MMGIVKDKTLGYLLEYAPWHPFAKPNGYVYQHRLIVERRIGRLLTDNECVHHFNGIRDDNRDENLLLSNKSEHGEIHHAPNVIKINCGWCGNAFSVRENAHGKIRKYCSIDCTNLASRRCIRPDRQKLINLLTTMNWCSIGRMFEVSDNAVKKWARKYKII